MEEYDEEEYREMNQEDDLYMGPDNQSIINDIEESENEEMANEDIYRKMNPNDPFYMGPEISNNRYVDNNQLKNKGCLILLLPLIGTALWIII